MLQCHHAEVPLPDPLFHCRRSVAPHRRRSATSAAVEHAPWESIMPERWCRWATMYPARKAMGQALVKVGHASAMQVGRVPCATESLPGIGPCGFVSFQFSN
jgi:hypothetical protein